MAAKLRKTVGNNIKPKWIHGMFQFVKWSKKETSKMSILPQAERCHNFSGLPKFSVKREVNFS